MGVSFYNGQVCVEGIICGSSIEIGITFMALFIIYVAYKVIYKKLRYIISNNFVYPIYRLKHIFSYG